MIRLCEGPTRALTLAPEFSENVQKRQKNPYFWEYEPMESTRDYQENIPFTSGVQLGNLHLVPTQ